MQLPEKTRETLMEKISQVECEPESNQKQKAEQLMSGAQTSDVLKQMQDAASFLKIVNIGESEDSLIDEKVKEMKKEMFTKNKELIAEKASSKDWQVKEEALTAMLECFESATDADIQANLPFVTECTILLKDSLETNNMQVYMAAL